MTKRQKTKLIRALIGLVIAGVIGIAQSRGWLEAPTQALIPVQPGYYRVTSFSDGDTIKVDMNGTTETIRMIGVDTPETSDPRKPVQCYGKAASAYTKELIGSNPVRLEADALSTNRDRYDRLLRYVYLPDGRMVEAEIIKNGYGFAYLSFPFTKSEEFHQYEVAARESNKGLWNSCSPTTEENGYQNSGSAN